MGTHWNRARVSHGQYLTRVEPDVSYRRLVFHRVDAAYMCFEPRQFKWAESRTLYDERLKAISVLLVVSCRRHRRLIDGRFFSKRYIATPRYIKWPRFTRQLRLRLWCSETRETEKKRKKESPAVYSLLPAAPKVGIFPTEISDARSMSVSVYLPTPFLLPRCSHLHSSPLRCWSLLLLITL